MIRVAIVGAGAISDAHIRAYQSFGERCQIIAICDIDAVKAQDKRSKYGLEIDVLQDPAELRSRSDLDLVSICTPPFTHAPLAISFLQAEKHVLVEKPMASSLEECDAMNEAANQAGRVLSVIGQLRFRDSMVRLKGVVESGLAGRIVHAQVDSHWWRGHCYYDLWWRGTWEKEGGGCTINHAVHHIDTFQWLMGMPSRVWAVMSNTSHDNAEVEDLSIAILSYDNGSLAQITSSVVHHGEEQQLVLQGKSSRISFPWKVTFEGKGERVPAKKRTA